MDFPFAMMALFDSQLKIIEMTIEEAVATGSVIAVATETDVFGFNVGAGAMFLDDTIEWSLDGLAAASRECVAAALAENFRTQGSNIALLNEFAVRLTAPGAIKTNIKVLGIG